MAEIYQNVPDHGVAKDRIMKKISNPQSLFGVLIILIKQFDELPYLNKILTDKNIVKKILNLANFRDKDVIEIGPGKGALTEEI